jgi:hypothetical protein
MKIETAIKKLEKLPGVVVEVKEVHSKLTQKLLYRKLTATAGEWRLLLNEAGGTGLKPWLEKLMGGEWRIKMASFDSVTEAIEWFEDTVVPHA